MKVVDMFGCGVPVAAIGFPCVGELVRDGANGRIFQDAEGLAKLLVTMLRGFPGECKELSRLREGARLTARKRWRDVWDGNAWPVLRDFVEAQ
mmetsp:Transcript_74961/g.175923  ORF Transcript_74961/g.175923 Transcript_74961/m.175923 type:complete len:93 (+) Transcript_74961:66-344(+)